MASTTTTKWYPMQRDYPQRWLLDDGSIMQEPALEETSSKRRVRVAGHPEFAVYSRDLESLLPRAAAVAASKVGRRLWMAMGPQLDSTSTDIDSKVSVSLAHFDARPRPIFLQSGTYPVTKVAWRFRHTSMPIEAQLEVLLRKGYHSWTVTTQVIYPDTWPVTAAVAEPTYFTHDDGDHFQPHGPMAASNLYYDACEAFKSWAFDNPLDFCDDFEFGATDYDSEREAITAFAKVLRAVEEIEEIEIPNLLDLDNEGQGTISSLSLRLYRTNCTQELFEALTDYLTGQPVIDQIKEHWKEMLSLFRRLGIVVPDVKDTDWWKFLVEGAAADPVEIKFEKALDDNETHVSKHAVKINLATGTIAVACSERITKDEQAVQYESSLIKAKLTGEEDVFLAYARKYAEDALTSKVEERVAKSLASGDPTA